MAATTMTGAHPPAGAATMAPGRQVPAASHAGVVTKTPEELSPEIKELMNSLRRLYMAETQDEYKMALRALDDDAYWDGPLVYVPGRERIRHVGFVTKTLVSADFEPRVVRIRMLDEKRAELEMDGVQHLYPKRRWWLPITWILPRDIPVKSTARIGVKGWNDKIAYFKADAHNIPSVIFPLRYIWGWGVGTAGNIIEPIYHQFLDWYRQGTTTISHGVDSISHAGPIEGVRETLGVGTHGGGSSGYTSAGQPQSAAGVMGTSGGGGPIKRDY